MRPQGRSLPRHPCKDDFTRWLPLHFPGEEGFFLTEGSVINKKGWCDDISLDLPADANTTGEDG